MPIYSVSLNAPRHNKMEHIEADTAADAVIHALEKMRDYADLAEEVPLSVVCNVVQE